MSVHTASQEDTTNARPSAYSGGPNRKPGGRPLLMGSAPVVQMSAQQMLPSEYWRGPDRRPEHRPV